MKIEELKTTEAEIEHAIRDNEHRSGNWHVHLTTFMNLRNDAAKAHEYAEEIAALRETIVAQQALLRQYAYDHCVLGESECVCELCLASKGHKDALAAYEQRISEALKQNRGG